jgi:TatD DNase family protein
MPPLVDSHAHLTAAAFDDDRPAVLQRARDAGVRHIIEIGYNHAVMARALALADAEPGFVSVALGFHPLDATTVQDGDLALLAGRLRTAPAAVAIGEIGLDYYHHPESAAVQARVFREQLALARELGLPVVIHSREAHADTLAILQRDGVPRGGVMHSFSGDLAYAEACVALGMLISFSGPLTFPRSHALHVAAAALPPASLLVETDAPYLAPQGRRGQRNEPAAVRVVAEHLARLRGVSVAEIAAATCANARRLFGDRLVLP